MLWKIYININNPYKKFLEVHFPLPETPAVH